MGEVVGLAEDPQQLSRVGFVVQNTALYAAMSVTDHLRETLLAVHHRLSAPRATACGSPRTGR